MIGAETELLRRLLGEVRAAVHQSQPRTLSSSGEPLSSTKNSPDPAPAAEPESGSSTQSPPSERHGDETKIVAFDFLVESDDIDKLDDEAKALRCAFAMHLKMLWLLMLSATRK